jgi:hypothetical protein
MRRRGPPKKGRGDAARRPLHKPKTSIYGDKYAVTNQRSTIDTWLLGYLFYLEAMHYLSRGGRISDHYLTSGWAHLRALRDTGDGSCRHSCWQDVQAAAGWLAQIESEGIQ